MPRPARLLALASILALGGAVGSCAEGLEPPKPTITERIPGGAFWMGGGLWPSGNPATAPNGDALDDGECFEDGEIRCSDERAVRRCVALSSFAIDATEVTNYQFLHCVERGGCTGQAFDNSGAHEKYKKEERFDEYPVVATNWFQAKKYCEWVGKRLPTEAEWEYTAKAGPLGNRFPWGDNVPEGCLDPDDDRAKRHVNIAECSRETHGDPKGSPVPVRHSEYDWDATGHGIFGLAGNVREWVADVYEPTANCASADVPFDDCESGEDCFRDRCPSADHPNCTPKCTNSKQFFCVAHAPDDIVSNPTGPRAGEERVIRGASYETGSHCKAETSARWHQGAGETLSNVGFRCAVDLLPAGARCSAPRDCQSGACTQAVCAPDEIELSCPAR